MKAFHIFIPLLSTILALAVSGDSGQNCAKEGSSRSPSLKVKNKILCNYDKEYRPVKNQKQAVEVSLRMIPKYMDGGSGTAATMDIQNWLGIVWKDEFLTWNPADYDSVQKIHVDSKEIWTPDLKEFKPTKLGDDAVFEDGSSCLVSNDGQVRCILDKEHETFCSRELEHWPYDRMHCLMSYTTGVYNSSEIKITKSRMFLAGLQPNSEWELTNASSSVLTMKKADQTYPLVQYSFRLKRHSRRTTAIIIVPALSLVAMTLVPLWMQPGNTERFSLIAANILSHFLFIQHVSWVASDLGANLPPAVTFFRDSLALAIVVLIELTLVKSLLAGRTASPTWLLTPCKLAGGVVGQTMLTEEVQEIKDEENSIQNDNKEAKTKKIQGERCLIVAVLDRILFFVLLIVYCVLFFALIPFN